MPERMALGDRGLEAGKLARLHRILDRHGLANGTALFLPYDQGLEHGPRDFFANPDAADPRYVLQLAVDGGFNAVVLQIGLAEKFYRDYAGEVPLILKLNGKTDIPADDEALSPLHASVEDARRVDPEHGTPVGLGSDRARLALRVRPHELDRVGVRRIRWHGPAVGSCTVIDAYLDRAERTISVGVREMACRLNGGGANFARTAEDLAPATRGGPPGRAGLAGSQGIDQAVRRGTRGRQRGLRHLAWRRPRAGRGERSRQVDPRTLSGRACRARQRDDPGE